jgi:hypothetical protein
VSGVGEITGPSGRTIPTEPMLTTDHRCVGRQPDHKRPPLSNEIGCGNQDKVDGRADITMLRIRRGKLHFLARGRPSASTS